MSRTGTTTHSASWWLVLLAGGLVALFGVAIVRELLRTRQVRQQVADLRSQVTTEQQRHQELQDLISYLSSPTFQEREARLQLGLKKSGERVILVTPDANTNSVNAGEASNGVNVTTDDGRTSSRWWRYFFPSDLPKS